MMKDEQELHDYVQNKLEGEGIRFDADVGVGGVGADYLIYTPDGRIFAVELKTWSKFAGFTNQAARQSQLLRSDIGVDQAFIVVQGLERSRIANGVVSPEKLLPAILDAIGKGPSARKSRAPSIIKAPERIIFAAMPFDKKYEDVYYIAMASAADQVNAVCKRIDLEEYSGDIVLQIQGLISRSAAVIADLSESNPNVLYEVGYAHGRSIPTIQICSTPLGELPFDVAHWNTIRYSAGQTHSLIPKISSRLKAVLGTS